VTNAPIVQPIFGPYRNVHADVGLYIAGVPNGTPYQLDGRSSTSDFNFSQRGRVAVNPVTHIGTTAVAGQAPLSNALGVSSVSIDWTLTLNPGTPQQVVLSLGRTGPLTLYRTYGVPSYINDPVGHPSNLLTDARLQIAEQWVYNAVSKAGGINADPRTIVQELWDNINTMIGFNDTQSIANGNYWDAYKYKGLDCISLATFASWVAEAMGLPGTFAVVTYAPNIFNGSTQYTTAVQGALKAPDSPQDVPPGADPSHFQDVYFNGDPNKRLYLFDGALHIQYFEATLVYIDTSITGARHRFMKVARPAPLSVSRTTTGRCRQRIAPRY